MGGCENLTSVTIPQNVTTIESSTFYGCSNLVEIYCKSTTVPTAINVFSYTSWDAFDENATNRKIYVPKESVEAYKSAKYWSDYADDIVGYDFEE